MHTTIFPISKMLSRTLLLAFFIGSQLQSGAQDDSSAITVYQYRHVPDNKIAEFIKRETTYWTKVADKAVKNKTMTFWALFEKIGGYNLPNSSNYLFINTFPNIDKVGEVFGSAEKIAGVPLAQMETNSMSTVTSEFYLHGRGWAQKENVNPKNDFNYVTMVYHDTNYPDSLIALENKYWSPFIKKTMDGGQTRQMAWGNAIVLSPSGEDIKFTTVSYDIYKTLKDALMPALGGNVEFPAEGLSKIGALEVNRRGSVVYRVVKVVASN